MKNNKFNGFFFVCIYSLLLWMYGGWYGYTFQTVTQGAIFSKAAFFITSIVIYLIYFLFIQKANFNLIGKKELSFLLGFIFIACFFRNNITSDLERFIAILITFSIVLILSRTIQSIELKKVIPLLTFILTITLIISALIHLKYYSINLFDRSNYYNKIGGLFHPGELGILAGFTAIMAAVNLVYTKNVKKIQSLVFFIVAIAVTLGTDSRNSMIAVIGALFVIIYPILKNSKILFVFSILFFIGVYLFVIYYINFESGGKDLNNDYLFRGLIWQTSLNGIIQQPIWGYGKINYFQTNINELYGVDFINDAHSSYLNFMLQFGVVAFVLFINLYYKIIKNYFFRYTENRLLFLSLPIYWFIATIAGGTIFDFVGNVFTSYLFGITFFGILSHPQLLSHKN